MGCSQRGHLALDPLVGRMVGRFRLVRRLSSGGMGAVYLGRHHVIGSQVAVKLLHPRHAADAAMRARFLDEARVANQVVHHHIVRVFDAGVLKPNRPYQVMEYLQGRPLASLLASPMPPQVALPILLQVCAGLEAAHRQRVIHRDLKPENIFLSAGGGQPHYVKLLDFGSGQVAQQRGGKRTVYGTAAFMAPEQWTLGKLDGRTDVYALGVTAYRMVTGEFPFEDREVKALCAAHRSRVPVAPHRRLSCLPPSWSEVILKAMAKRADDRFQSAAEMAQALKALSRAIPPPLPLARLCPPPLPRTRGAGHRMLRSDQIDAIVGALERVGDEPSSTQAPSGWAHLS